MLKKISSILFLLLLLGCSNVSSKKTILPPNKDFLISEKNQEIKDLDKLISILKTAFSKHQFFIIRRHTKMSLTNRIKLNKLEKMDMSEVNIYTGKPKFFENKAEVMAMFNFYDENIYLTITFEYKNDQWKIVNFEERR